MWAYRFGLDSNRERNMITARMLGTHTEQEWHAMLRLYNFCCVRCGRFCNGRTERLTKDHIIPIFHGGSDAITNLQPLCKECNALKGLNWKDYRRAWNRTPMRYFPLPVDFTKPVNFFGLWTDAELTWTITPAMVRLAFKVFERSLRRAA